MSREQQIRDECAALADMLIAKNAAYGDSAMNPLRIFSRALPDEQLRVRIDDKLSRIARGSEYVGDDTVLDLIGYLVLYRIALRKLDLKMPEGWNDPRQEPREDVGFALTDVEVAEVEQAVDEHERDTDGREGLDSVLLGCEIAYRREPTQAEGDAHELPRCDGAIRECHVLMGDHHGHRCACGKWVWGGPTVCQRCTDAAAVKLSLESFDLERRLRADAQANLESEKNAHAITRGMLEACADRIVKLIETIRQREQEHLEACAEADEFRADLVESNALLTRVEKYAREDRAVTPGVTRLARVLDEIRVVLDERPLDERPDVTLTEKGRAAVLSDLGMTLSPEQVAQAKSELAASLDAIKREAFDHSMSVNKERG